MNENYPQYYNYYIYYKLYKLEYSPIDLVRVYIKTVTNIAAVKNKPTAIINMITKICFPEFSLRPGQSKKNTNTTILIKYL